MQITVFQISTIDTIRQEVTDLILAVHENSGERLQSVTGGQGVPSEGSGAVAVVGRLAEIKDDD